ncbi:unnamed protein product, partial [Ectocarpus sp. 12 AP-2014]
GCRPNPVQDQSKEASVSRKGSEKGGGGGRSGHGKRRRGERCRRCCKRCRARCCCTCRKPLASAGPRADSCCSRGCPGRRSSYSCGGRCRPRSPCFQEKEAEEQEEGGACDHPTSRTGSNTSFSRPGCDASSGWGRSGPAAPGFPTNAQDVNAGAAAADVARDCLEAHDQGMLVLQQEEGLPGWRAVPVPAPGRR